jgi:uncharacterized protein YjiS (DUF1127 family)
MLVHLKETNMSIRNPTLSFRQIRFGNHCRIVLETMAAFARRCFDRRRQRLDLDALDDAALKDIGLSPEDVRRECAKPFWH